MADANKRVVWILGAGFCVPLGGPLFRELISEVTLQGLRNWPDYVKAQWWAKVPNQQGYGSRPTSAAISARVVAWLYEAGLGNDDTKIDDRDRNEGARVRLWQDAEQFLERLEIAASEPSRPLGRSVFERIKSLSGKDPDEQVKNSIQAFQVTRDDEGKSGLDALNREALRYVAGACSEFLVRFDETPELVDKTEQWDPYRRWSEQLEGGRDSVITFNYDRALDILGEYRRRKGMTDSFLSPVGITAARFKAFHTTCVPVYHLHGHVGWIHSSDRTSIQMQPLKNGFQVNPAVAHQQPENAVIGVPGKFKLSLPDELLESTWDLAMDDIRAADAIVFMGYRFPETDNMAKRVLLNAVKKSKGPIHIVLGAPSKDTARLVGMLKWARPKGFVPDVHEMLAQDFLAVYEPTGLF